MISKPSCLVHLGHFCSFTIVSLLLTFLTSIVSHLGHTNTFPDNTLYIGSRAGSSLFFNGELSDLRIWDYNLSPAEIYSHVDPQTMWELYEPEIPIFYSMPVAAAVNVSNPPRLQPMRIWKGVR